MKRTLTDFRISGLDCPELEWSWKADKANVEVVVHAILSNAANEESANPDAKGKRFAAC